MAVVRPKRTGLAFLIAADVTAQPLCAGPAAAAHRAVASHRAPEVLVINEDHRTLGLPASWRALTVGDEGQEVRRAAARELSHTRGRGRRGDRASENIELTPG